MHGGAGPGGGVVRLVVQAVHLVELVVLPFYADFQFNFFIQVIVKGCLIA